MGGASAPDEIRAPDMRKIHDIAVLLPCHNEAITIAQVVRDFRESLPRARIYVFDNASTDNTAAVARDAGATVLSEPRKGKGNVVRRMFSEIEADIYVMADGDSTYDPSSAPKLIEALVTTRSDMAVGSRQNVRRDAGRRGHAFGNVLFNTAYAWLFGKEYSDIFSGYRVFSRRFVKSFPALSRGFETETEMSVFASQLRLPIIEIDLPYGKRPEGSTSKLSSIRDGVRILFTFFALFQTIRPKTFFGILAGMASTTSLVLAVPLLTEYLATGLVPRLPTAILCTGLMLTALLLMCCGLIMGSIARAQAENMRLFYLSNASGRPAHHEENDDVEWSDIEKSAALPEGGDRRVRA